MADCSCCGFNRRDFLKFASVLAASAGLGISPLGARAEGGDDQPVLIGYLPITDSAPLLVGHAKRLYEAEGLTAEAPRLFRSWAQIAEAFLARQVNVVHLLMPATIWIRYARSFPAKVVAWNHTNGSALTVLPEIEKLSDLGGKTVAIPFWYSVHNVVLQQILRQAGLTPVTRGTGQPLAANEVRLSILAPSDMVSALANRSIAGYIVAEPFNAAAEGLKTGRILRFTGDVWRDHACCVVFMHEDDLRDKPQWSQRVVNAIVKSQAWSRQNRVEVARILSKEGGKYTPHAQGTLERVLTYYDKDFYGKLGAIHHVDWPVQRIDFQPYPFASYTEELVRLLKNTQVEGDAKFLESLDAAHVAKDLVDASFVKKAIQSIGGPQVFGLGESLTRTEVFEG